MSGRGPGGGRGGGRFGGRGRGATNPLHTGGGRGFGRGRGRGRGGRGGGGGGGGGFGGEDGGKTREQLEEEACRLEEQLGFEAFTEGPVRLGFLMNMSPARAPRDGRTRTPRAGRPSSRGSMDRQLNARCRAHRAPWRTARRGSSCRASTVSSCARCATSGGARRGRIARRRCFGIALTRSLRVTPRPQDGTTFKAQVKFAPYFLLATKARVARRCGALRRKSPLHLR
jgi:hypothetical protein